MTNETGGGIGFLGMLTILFIGLKLGHVIDWGWLWVLAPLWIPVAIVILIMIVLGLYFFFMYMAFWRY